MAEDVVAGSVVSVTVPEEVDETEEGGGAADKVRQLSKVLTYWIRLVVL